MKRALAVAAMFLIAAGAGYAWGAAGKETPAAAQIVNVGYVDETAVFEGYLPLEKALAEFSGLEAKARAEHEHKLDMEIQELLSSPDANGRPELEELIRRRDAEFAARMKGEKERLTAPELEKIRAAIAGAAEGENVDVAISRDSVFYGGRDLTDKALEALNRESGK